ncbi:MAG: exodeoxyribonuclease III [Clostridiales bacterium]|jgi:exodeoxyribonuclease-3|nr:exodeoxyribonuclease III [Clostridiales bacterium]
MKFISWNVNGLRACINKGFEQFFKEADADVFCIQETKLQPEQVEIAFEGYHQYFNSAVKKGYSGTAIFTRKEPIKVSFDLGLDKHNDEGRVITLEYEEYYFVTVYTPNSQRELARLDYRMKWEDDFREYIMGLDQKKPVILCGDLNVAHKEIDLKNPKTNTRNAGFTIEERDKFTTLLDSGFVDTFRYLYPDVTGAYTWWSYMFNARANNAGWRIDYFLVSDRIKDGIIDSLIYSDVMGSDHCPVGLIWDSIDGKTK